MLFPHYNTECVGAPVRANMDFFLGAPLKNLVATKLAAV